jgi:hypothetical protein
VLGVIAVAAGVWIGAAGPVWTEAVAQVSVGIVGLGGIVVALAVFAGPVEVEADIAAGAEVAGPDAMSVAVVVVVGVQVWIAAARVAVVVWDGPRVESDGLVAPAGGCWVRLDGRQVGRGARSRRGGWLVDQVELLADRAGRIRLGGWVPWDELPGWGGLCRVGRRWDAGLRPRRDGPC